MSSSRLSYDSSAYASEVRKSITPLEYAVNPVFARNCERCVPEVGSVYPANINFKTDSKIDVENSLSSRTWRRDRRQPGGSTPQEFEDLALRYGNADPMNDCPASYETRNSLLTDPKSNSRSLSTLDLVFNVLPIDAQDYVPVIGDPGINSRQAAVDEYRKIVGSS